jgi:hypothetical protein
MQASCVALGCRNWTLCGSDRGGERAAAIYSPIATTKLNDIDPEAWLTAVLHRISDHPASKLDELLPWNGGCMSAPQREKPRMYADFNSCMRDDRGMWCWLPRHQGNLA